MLRDEIEKKSQNRGNSVLRDEIEKKNQLKKKTKQKPESTRVSLPKS